MARFTQMIMASMVSRRSAEAAAAALYACETRLLGMFEHDDSLARCALRGGFPKTTMCGRTTQRVATQRGGACSGRPKKNPVLLKGRWVSPQPWPH